MNPGPSIEVHSPCKRPSVSILVLIISASFSLYLLGIGPAARLDAKGITPPWIYETFYWPLVSFAQSSFGQSAGLGRLLDWYVMDVWKPYSPAPAPPGG